MTGQILILNGAPRSGKSTLAQAIRAHVPGNWLIWGVDAYNALLPQTQFPGIGLRPGGERPDIEALLPQMFEAYFGLMALMAQTNFDVIADLGLHNHYATPFDPLAIFQRHCAQLPTTMIGITCGLETIMARRNADPSSAYAKGPGVPEPVQRWQDAVHANKTYDLTLDMGVLSPADGAQLVHEHLGRL